MRPVLARLLPVLLAAAFVVALIWLLAGAVDDPRLEAPAPATQPR